MEQKYEDDELRTLDSLSGSSSYAVPAARRQRFDWFTNAYASHKIFVVVLLLIAVLISSYGGWALVRESHANPDKAAATSDSAAGQRSIVILPSRDQVLTINPKLSVQNDTVIKGDFSVTGSTSLNSLKVNGDIVAAQNGTFGGDVTANNIIAQNIKGSFSGTYKGDGSALTGLAAANLSGTLSDARLSANVTVQGNTFNRANELVKLDDNGALPSASGVYLTDINAATLNGQAISYFTNAANFSSGTLSDARLSTNVALLNASNTFTNTNTFATNLAVQGTVNGQSAVFSNAVAALTFTQNGNVVCDSSGNCGGGGGGSGIAGSGTTDKLALFTAAGAIGDSIISQSGATITVAGTLTASAFQGDGSTLTSLNASNVSSGTLADGRLSGNVPLLNAVTNTFTGTIAATALTGSGAGVTGVNAAQLNGQIGSYYTNATNLSSGTLADGRLSANVTLAGNTFNGPSQLVQLTAGGLLPSLNGSNVSSVNAAALQGFVASYFTNATNLASGTVADARLSSNVALLGAGNTFTGATNTFSGVAATNLTQNGNNVCDTSGNCSGVGGGVTTPGGTSGTLALFSAGQQIANSILTQASTTVTVAGTLVATALQGNGSAITNLNASSVSSGTLAVNFGGTGANTFTSNGVLYGNGTGALQATTAGTTGQCLVANTAAAPSWLSCVSAGSGGTPGGAAGGDLSGTYPDPTVAKLQGTTLSVAGLTSGDFLLYDGVNWVNHGLSGDITVTGGGVATIGAGTVSNAKLVNSSLSVTAGSGLVGGGSVALGGSTSVSVAYGSVANTAVQGNTTLVCASGTGNLAGGGGTITLGSGGSCGNLNTVASPTFTSITLTNPLDITSGGTGSATAAGARTNLGAAALGANGDITSLAGLTTALSVTQGGSGAETFTSNGILYGNASGALQATAAGITGQCLVGSTAAAPTWTSCTSAAGGATPGGAAGGDLTGTYPNPTIALLQGSTLTIATPGTGQVLQYNGSAFVNALLTNANLTSGAYASVTGTGILASGSIAAGFGNISTTNSISTTAGLQGGSLSINSGAFAVSAAGAITAATGITTSGAITFSGLSSAGVVHADASGVLSTGAVALGTDTTGDYVSALGSLTGLSATGNSGVGSTPTLSVTYGSAISTAAQGNTSLSFSGSANLTGTVSGTAGGGFSANTLAIINNPTFSGLLTASGGLSAVGESNSGNYNQIGTGTFSTGSGAVALNGNTTIAGVNTLTVGTGATTLGGTLGITGLTTLSGGATVTGATSITGDTTINTSGAAGTSIGNAGSTVTLGGATTVNNTLTVSNGAGVVGSFSGRVSGADAVSNNEFTTLSQVTGAVASGSGNANYVQNGTSLQTSANFNIQSAAPASIGGVVRAALSQTADLLQLQDSSGVAMGGFNNLGQLYSRSGAFSGTLVQGALSQNTAYTIPASTGAADTFCLVSLNNCVGAGAASIGALDGGTANANGATIATGTLFLQSASASFAGLVNTGAQTLAGAKTLAGATTLSSTLAVTGVATFNNTVTVQTATNSTTALQVQNAAGNNIFAVDTSGAQIVLGKPGASGVNGKLVVNNAANANTVTVVSGTTSANYQLTLPTALSGVAGDCLKDTTGAGVLGFGSCGVAGVTLQATTPGVADTGNFNISGTGIAATFKAGTSLLAPLLDTASAAALNIGTTNATGINLNQNTTLASGKTFSVQGAATFQNATNSLAAFSVKDSSGASALAVDTTNRWVGIGNSSPSATLDVVASTPAYFNNFESGLLTPFTTSGGATQQWSVTTSASPVPYSGSYVAQVYAPNGTNNVANLILTKTLTGAGNVSFWYQCTSYWSGFTFQIDSGTKNGMAGCGGWGTSGWLYASYGVAAGAHTFTWSFDGVQTGGNPSMSVDNVNITNVGSGTAALFNGGGVGIDLGAGNLPAHSLDVLGDAQFMSQTNSATAFQVQNAAGNNIFAVDTSGAQIVLGKPGAGGVSGKLVVNNATNANTVTVVSGTTSSSYQLTLPTALSGVAGDCLKDTTGAGVLGFGSCGVAGVTLQATTPGTPDTGNFNISGTGIAATFKAGTSLLAPLLDTATAVALNIGTTNATGINLNQNTAIASGKALTANGNVLFKAASASTTAFQVQNVAAGALLTADTTNQQVTINGNTQITPIADTPTAFVVQDTGGDNLLSVGQGVVSVINNNLTTNSPTGSFFNNASWVSGQYVTLGAGSSNGELEYSAAAGIDFDATFQLYATGFADGTWFYADNTSTPTSPGSASGGYSVDFNEWIDQIELRYNGTVLQSIGNGTIDNSTWHSAEIKKSGTNIIVKFDGSIVINYTDSARSLTGTKYGLGGWGGALGSPHRVRNFLVVDTQGSSGSQFKYKSAINSVAAFQIQSAAGSTTLLNADTTNLKLSVNQTQFILNGFGTPATPTIVAASNQGGTLSGASGTTYYYKVSTLNAAGESVPSAEASIAASTFTPLTAPGVATLATAAGTNLGIGAYMYKVTFVTANGETTGGSEATITTTASNQAVALSAIPLGPTGTTQRKIYRTVVGGGTGTELLLTTLADNVTTTYADSTVDGSLGAALPGSNTARTNLNNATVTFTPSLTATSYKLYRGTGAGAENVYQTMPSSPFTDTGAAGTGGTVMASDTAARLGVGTATPNYTIDAVGSINSSISVLSPLLDTATAIALNIGTTNATAINLNQNTTLASGKTLTVQGTSIFQNSAYTTNAYTFNNGVTGATPAIPNGYLPTIVVRDSQTSSSRPLFFGYDNGSGTGWASYLTAGACGSMAQMCVDLGNGATNYTALQNSGTTLNIGGGPDGNFTVVNFGNTGSLNTGSGAVNLNGNTKVSGTLQAPSLDTTTAVALDLGSANATNINLNQNTTLAAGKTLTALGLATFQNWVGIGNYSPSAPLDVTGSAPGYFNNFESGVMTPLTTDDATIWQVLNNTSYSGSYSAVGSNPSNIQGPTYHLNLTKTLTAAGNISFYYNCSWTWQSAFTFQVDGGTLNNLGVCNGLGTSTTWTLVSFGVSAGTHTFNWGLRSAGGAAGSLLQLKVDNITVTNVGIVTGPAAVFNGNVGVGLGSGIMPNYALDVLGGTHIQALTDNTSNFSLQNASGLTTLFNADTTNLKLSVNQSNFVINNFGTPATPSVAAGTNQGGSFSGAAGTTYYYKVSALNAAGESVPSAEASIAASTFTPLTAPGVATLATAAGTNLGIGAYMYKVTFVTANGETTGGSEATITTTASNQAVALSAIPLGPTGTTQRKIYRTVVGGGTGTELLLTTLADNVTTTYADSTVDGSLGAALPGSNTARTNLNNATITFTAVTGATSYKVYRGTAVGAENVFQSTATSPFTDTGAAGTGGSVAASDGTGRLGVGTATPNFSIDAVGSINASVDLRVGGVVICTSAGCTPTGGAGVTLQGSTPGTQQTGNFNISGTGIASVLQTATLDTASAVALNIGTTNATGINLNQNTTLASTKTLTIQGVATFQNASNSTSAFKINDASGSGVLTVNTSNQYVGIDVATALAPLDVGLSNGGPYSNDFETGALAPLTTTGGWTVNNTAAHSGGYSAASGLNGANFSPYTEMSLVKTLSSSGTVSFWRSTLDTQQESRFYIDGVQQELYNGGGSTFAQSPSFAVSSGVHTFTWRSYDGNCCSAKTNAVRVDDILITNVTGSPISGVFRGNVGVGNTSPSNLLSMNTLTTASAAAQLALSTGLTGNIGAVIQGVASQTGDLLDLQTSTGANLFSVGATGAVLLKNSSDSATAFQVQNAAGNNIFSVDTSGAQIVLGKPGAGGVSGKLVVNNATNANTVTVVSGTTSASYQLTLPTALSGVAGDCLKDTTGAGILGFGSCGVAGVTLQATTPGTPDTGNFNVSGTGIAATFKAGTSLLAPLLDTATAAALNIGTTNATGINLNQNTAIGSGKTFTANGTALFQNASDSAGAFQVQTAGGGNLFNIGTSNNQIDIGTSSTPLINDNLTTSTPTGSLIGSATWSSGSYVQLNSGSYSNGEVEYTPALVSQNFDANFQFNTTGGADATYLYAFDTSTPSDDSTARGGYHVAFNEFSGIIRLYYNGTLLATYSVATINNSTWHGAEIVKSGTNIKVYYDSSLVINYTDSSRSLTGVKLGLGGWSGGGSSTHRVRNFTVSTGSGVLVGNVNLKLHGTQLIQPATDSTTALQVQNAAGNNIFSVDTSGAQIVLGKPGAGGVSGKLVVNNATNANTVTVVSGTTSASYQLTLPTALSGVAGDCLKDTTGAGVLGFGSCGVAGVTLQATTPGTPDTGNLNISGTGIAATFNASTSLLAPLLDTASAVALNIGTTNATGINLNQNTAIASGKTLTVNGTTLVKTTSATAFQVQNAAGTSMLTFDTTNGSLTVQSATNSTLALQVLDSSGNVIFTVDTQNKRVGINTATPGSTLTVNGGNNVNPVWPDGMVGTPLAAYEVAGTSTYTVPAGKTLYLESYYNSTITTNLKDASGVVYIHTQNVSFASLTAPTPIAAGTVLSSSDTTSDWSITGLLVPTNVTPLAAYEVAGTSTYTVPAGKTLYLESYYNSTITTNLKDASGVVYIHTQNVSFASLTAPTPIAAGTVLSSSDTTSDWSITGYLTNSNGLGGP